MFVVTGGAGFIGSNIVASLEERYPDEKIVVCDRLRDGVKWRNIAKRDLYDIIHPEDLFDFLMEYAEDIKAIIQSHGIPEHAIHHKTDPTGMALVFTLAKA